MSITKGNAVEFMRDLRGTVYGNPNKADQGVMSPELVAEHLKISVEKANAYLWAAVRFGLSDRANGMFVI